jgi:hypothetical protein
VCGTAAHPRAGNNVATEAVVNASPDGYMVHDLHERITAVSAAHASAHRRAAARAMPWYPIRLEAWRRSVREDAQLHCLLIARPRLVIRRSKLAHGAVRHPAIDLLVVVVAVEDEARWL